MHILPLTDSHISHLSALDGSFTADTYISPIFDGTAWHYLEKPLDTPYHKVYEDPTPEEASVFIHDEDHIGYVAVCNGQIAGYILLLVSWNGYARVDDLRVDTPWRRNGIARALLQAGENWARQKGCFGLSLESQTCNPAACKLYAAYGFMIGGADTMLYSALPMPYTQETAIYWYYPFSHQSNP